jgi:hypothetical protein
MRPRPASAPARRVVQGCSSGNKASAPSHANRPAAAGRTCADAEHHGMREVRHCAMLPQAGHQQRIDWPQCRQ